MKEVLADLQEEQADLDERVSGLTEEQWDLVTPSAPWTIRDQIGHLAFFEEKVALSAGDADSFNAELQTILDQGIDTFLSQHIERARSITPAAVLDWWRSARAEAIAALGGCDPDQRLPWYGPPMRASSSATARLMETWAHGLDVADALGVQRPPTDRLFRVAELGVRTFRFSYENRGMEVPEQRVRVALRGPTGNLRVWNDECDQSVTGPVEEFCQVIAQRRHVDDTHLFCEGPLARQWMELAQVFAGPPGPGRPPRNHD